MAINIVIVEDSTLVRKGLVSIIQGFTERFGGFAGHAGAEHEYRVVADVSTPKELYAVLATERVDLVLLDYSLDLTEAQGNPINGIDGQSLIKWLRKQYPGTAMVVVSSHRSPIIVRMALEAGALGYLSKGTTEGVLHQAITAVLRNEVFVEHSLLKDVLNSNVTDATLSQKEIEVLRLISKGQRLTDISRQMNLSIKTVSAHKLRAMDKLNVSSDLALYRVISEMAL